MFWELLRQARSWVPDIVKEWNPLRITALPTHLLMYVVSPWSDTFIPNPNFNPDAEDISTIYCLHGVVDRAGAFYFIVDLLQKRLPENIKGINLPVFEDRLEGISNEDYAYQLLMKINNNEDSDVILMGHSRGAIISSWFTENLAHENQIDVRQVVAICGPFRGSYAANYVPGFFSTSINEIKTDTKFLVELSKQICKSKTKYMFIGAEEDQLLMSDAWIPYNYPRDTKNCFYLDRHTHLSIMTSHRIVDAIVSVLEECGNTLKKAIGCLPC